MVAGGFCLSCRYTRGAQSVIIPMSRPWYHPETGVYLCSRLPADLTKSLAGRKATFEVSGEHGQARADLQRIPVHHGRAAAQATNPVHRWVPLLCAQSGPGSRRSISSVQKTSGAKTMSPLCIPVGGRRVAESPTTKKRTDTRLGEPGAQWAVVFIHSGPRQHRPERKRHARPK